MKDITSLDDAFDELATLGDLLMVTKDHIFNAYDWDKLNTAHALLQVFVDRFGDFRQKVADGVTDRGRV